MVIAGNVKSGHLNDNAESAVGELNIPREERETLKTIDTDALNKLIDRSIDERSMNSLRVLQLGKCGPYTASRLRDFEKTLAEYGAAKAPKKLAETESRARRAGSNLLHAVQQMKHRVETEEKEDQLFYIDDQITPPHHFSEHLTVRVSYRWRRTVEDEWKHGSITFTHDVDLSPDYTRPQPKGKPSASKLAQDRQEKLRDAWEYLMRSALHSVREFFREGGDAAAIPETFQANVNSYGRGLNNSSTRFWQVRS